jgi:pilus assembly protein Flp/PilA
VATGCRNALEPSRVDASPALGHGFAFCLTYLTEREEKKMKTMLKRLWKEEEGQDLIEYALLVALIALIAATIFPTIGADLHTIFNTADTCLTSHAC